MVSRFGPSLTTVIVPVSSLAARASRVSADTSVSRKVIRLCAAGRPPSFHRSPLSVPGSGWVTSAGPNRTSVTCKSGRDASEACTVAIVR